MKMKFLNRLWKDTKGATAVEFGMVAVLFLLMIFGTIELGRIFWVYNTMQSALEQTARYYITNTATSDAALQTYAQGKMTAMKLDGSLLTVTVTKTTSLSIKFIQFDGTYAYSPLLTIIPQFSGLHFTSKTRISYP